MTGTVCTTPTALPHAEVALNQTTAVYFCNHGYAFVGESSSIQCLSPSEWSPLKGECQVTCGPPATLERANVTYNSTTEGSFAMYSCQPGSVFIGENATSQCLSTAVWSGLSGSCLANCSLPPTIFHAVGRYKSTLEGATVDYKCELGYSFAGSNSTITCQQSGKWSKFNDTCSVCNLSLALGIPDPAFTASSVWDDRNYYHGPDRARFNSSKTSANNTYLGYEGAWVPKTNVNVWLQLDLGGPHAITGMSTKGRESYAQYVTAYQLQYSLDAGNWTAVKDAKGTDLNFTGNTDDATPKFNSLTTFVTARYVRFLPVACKTNAAMRVDVFGCL